MLQFLTYLLHKQIIEMRRSQNLRCPFSVPSRRLCFVRILKKELHIMKLFELPTLVAPAISQTVTAFAFYIRTNLIYMK